MELVKRLSPSNGSDADTVVVGFKQALYNDASSLAGELRKERLGAAVKVLEKTLSYPRRSSVFRSIVANMDRVELLMKTLGWFSAGVTLYAEIKDIKTSCEQMQRARMSY